MFDSNFEGAHTVAFGVEPTIAATLVEDFIAKLEQEGYGPKHTGSCNNETSTRLSLGMSKWQFRQFFSQSFFVIIDSLSTAHDAMKQRP